MKKRAGGRSDRGRMNDHSFIVNVVRQKPEQAFSLHTFFSGIWIPRRGVAEAVIVAADT
jgi:hypothetical protein